MACCATKPDTGCSGGLSAEQCIKFCKDFSSCAECAAQPACGWCAENPGTSGQCIPALNGEDHRSQMPSRCEAAWFYRPNDPEITTGAPFCPPVPVPGEAAASVTSGGES